MIKIKCEICKKEIINPNSRQKTCSHKCAEAYPKADYIRKKRKITWTFGLITFGIVIILVLSLFVPDFWMKIITWVLEG